MEQVVACGMWTSLYCWWLCLWYELMSTFVHLQHLSRRHFLQLLT